MPSSSDEDASDESRSSRCRSADRSRAWDAVKDLGFAAAARAAAAKPKSLTASHARLRSALRQRDDLDSSEASSSEEDGMELGS